MHPVTRFRYVGLLEGWSFLILLFIAMPLKYGFDMPMAVRVVGMAHGVLFVAYCLSLMQCWNHQDWSFGRAGKLFAAAFIPGGTLYTDRGLKAEVEASGAA